MSKSFKSSRFEDDFEYEDHKSKDDRRKARKMVREQKLQALEEDPADYSTLDARERK